jgi:hypothetical protein
VSRLSAGMADINAVVGSSAYIMALANLELGVQNEVAKYRANLELQREDKKQALIMQGISDMVKLETLREGAYRMAINTITEMTKAKIVAKNDEIGLNLQYAAKEITWYLELHRMSLSAINALSGTPTVPPALTKEQQALSNMMMLASAITPFLAFI